ncbi:MAG: hypothetical protein ABEI27_13155 [Halobellus sp.]|uniref:hypothetical protein n=1 Tax=Halobellus sp. TaxID=1979212 RepID=UPI0035D4AEB4
MSRTRSAVLWGLVGTLAFLVLVQGYRLAVGRLGVDVLTSFGFAALIGAIVAVASYLVEPRLASKGRT